MKNILIGFIASVMTLMIVISIIAFWTEESSLLEIGSFIILSITLMVLIWYAYDTNTIAKVTQERWKRDGVLSTTYTMELTGKKGEVGVTYFRIHNPSTLIVRAKVNCNFNIYGEPVSAGGPYDGTENWLAFPQQITIGWFEIQSLLLKKGKTVAIMISEFSQTNRKEQLAMDLELEFWDELDNRRLLPKRLHYFDFDRWAWIPQITER